MDMMMKKRLSVRFDVLACVATCISVTSTSFASRDDVRNLVIDLSQDGSWHVTFDEPVSPTRALSPALNIGENYSMIRSGSMPQGLNLPQCKETCLDSLKLLEAFLQEASEENSLMFFSIVPGYESAGNETTKALYRTLKILLKDKLIVKTGGQFDGHNELGGIMCGKSADLQKLWKMISYIYGQESVIFYDGKKAQIKNIDGNILDEFTNYRIFKTEPEGDYTAIPCTNGEVGYLQFYNDEFCDDETIKSRGI